MRRRKGFRLLLPLFLILLLLAGAFLAYAGSYYHAEPAAEAALRSDAEVRVMSADFGWIFDGPGEEDALIFYPGGKVEESAYAPLLRRLAAGGLDVFLVRMPFRLAVLDGNAADRVLPQFSYERWYIGGHSLGGVMAASYAAAHTDEIRGLAILAAYPTGALPDTLTVVSVCGSEDGVIDRGRLEQSESLLPEGAVIAELEGGNHARFGNYGPQAGDGEASLSAEEQQEAAAALILQSFSVEG